MATALDTTTSQESGQAVKSKGERSSHLQQYKGNSKKRYCSNNEAQLQEVNVVLRMQQLVINQGIVLSVSRFVRLSILPAPPHPILCLLSWLHRVTLGLDSVGHLVITQVYTSFKM